MRYEALQSFVSPNTGNITAGEIVHLHEKIGKQFELAKLVRALPEDFTKPAGEGKQFWSSLAGQASRVLTLQELGEEPEELEPLPLTVPVKRQRGRKSSTPAILSGGIDTDTQPVEKSAGRSTRWQRQDLD